MPEIIIWVLNEVIPLVLGATDSVIVALMLCPAASTVACLSHDITSELAAAVGLQLAVVKLSVSGVFPVFLR